jgi:hypothetical protein
MKDDPVYTPSDCFETYPLPALLADPRVERLASADMAACAPPSWGSERPRTAVRRARAMERDPRPESKTALAPISPSRTS